MLQAGDDDQCRGEISEVLPITLMNECVCVCACVRAYISISITNIPRAHEECW